MLYINLHISGHWFESRGILTRFGTGVKGGISHLLIFLKNDSALDAFGTLWLLEPATRTLKALSLQDLRRTMSRRSEAVFISTRDGIIVSFTDRLITFHACYLCCGIRGTTNGSVGVNGCRFKTIDPPCRSTGRMVFDAAICLFNPDLTAEFSKDLSISLCLGSGDILFYDQRCAFCNTQGFFDGDLKLFR